MLSLFSLPSLAAPPLHVCLYVCGAGGEEGAYVYMYMHLEAGGGCCMSYVIVLYLIY